MTKGFITSAFAGALLLGLTTAALVDRRVRQHVYAGPCYGQGRQDGLFGQHDH